MGIRIVYLEGVLMDNNEFICQGKSLWLTKEMIEKYVKEVDVKKIKEEKKLR